MTISTFPPDRNASFPSMGEPQFPIEARSDDFDLTSGLRLIRRRAVMIVALSMILMAAAAPVISGLKPTYHAESRLMIHRPLATTLSAEDSGRNDPLDLTSETERLLSRSVAERAIRDLLLDQRPEFNPALRKPSLVGRAREILRGRIDSEKPSLPIPTSMEPIIGEYYRALSVGQRGKSDVIDIGFDASDPELAAAAANRLISIYLEERKDSIRGRLDAAGEWIRQRIAEQQDRTKAASDAAGKYQKKMGVVADDDALEAVDDASVALQKIAIPDSIGEMERDLRVQQRDLDRLLEKYNNNAEAVVDLRAKILKSRIDLGLTVDRYLRAKVAAQAMLQGVEVEVLSPAAVPLAPQGRGRLFYLIGALLASISIAVTAAFVLEMSDKTVRSFDQLAGMPGILPAGFIPRLGRKDRRNPSMPFGKIQGGMFDEAIRAVVISLKQSNGGKLPNSIVVTSAHSGDGKSLVARSLAVELVANGSPVLLVDSDLRRGNLDLFFKSGLKHGLNEFLSGQAGISDVIHHHVQSGVDFIPAGNPSLHRRPHLTDVAEVIGMARASGQIVIFDSAPVLASTDTMHLTALAERTLMVVHWGKTSRRAVEYSVKQLKSFQNTKISLIINNVKPSKHALYNFLDSELFAGSLIKYHNSET